MMEFNRLILFITLPARGFSSNAVQIILGGSWFSSTSLGESSGYLSTSFKEKIFEPLMGRIVERIYQNEMEMRTLVLSLILLEQPLDIDDNLQVPEDDQMQEFGCLMYKLA